MDPLWSETCWGTFNPLNAELNPICHLLALLGAHHIFHVSGLRVKYFIILIVSTCYILCISWIIQCLIWQLLINDPDKTCSLRVLSDWWTPPQVSKVLLFCTLVKVFSPPFPVWSVDASHLFSLHQCFSTFVRPRPGKFFFHKTRAQSQQIYSSVLFQFFFKLT